MSILRRLCACSFLILCLLSTLRAQGENLGQRATQTSTGVTASATAERVRFTAPSNVVRMQLRVVSDTGQFMFEVSSKGNVLDWTLQDSSGQRLQGSYLTVVTVKSLSGKLSERIGTVSVDEKQVELKPLEANGLTPAQQQALGPIEENGALTILKAGETQATTVLANDGQDGHMIRGRGALTFRIGDFFSGLDREQMRLTEDGRLGIGTSEPEANLDVAGTIRAERFLIAKPKSAGDKTATNSLTTDSGFQPLITGTGTQDRIAKWTDNAGTLGDSAITETGGNVGIGTTTPGSKLVVSSNSAPLPPASGVARFADADGVQTAVFADAFGTNPVFNVRRANGTAAAPSAIQANQLLGVIGAAGFGASAYMGTRARVGFFASENWTNTANGSYLTFNTTANGAATAGGAERMRIDNAGNVGIGTTAPLYPLSVFGNGGAGANIAAAEFANANSDTGLRLRNTTAGGRSWSLFSSGTGSGNGTGRFNIYDATAGVSRFSIDGNGRVGIGPLASGGGALLFPLSVSGASNIFPGVVSEFRNSENLTSIMLFNEMPGGNSAWGVGAFRSTSIVNPGGFSIVDWTTERARFSIDRDGRAIIGTDGDPTNNWQNAQLRISGATNPNKQLNLGYDTTTERGFIQAGNSGVAFNELLLNPFGGKVGIGKTHPGSALDVNGEVESLNKPRTSFQQGVFFPDGRTYLAPSDTYDPLDQLNVTVLAPGYLHVTVTIFPYQFTGPQLCASANLFQGATNIGSAGADMAGSRSTLHIEKIIPVTPGNYSFRTTINNCSGTTMQMSNHSLIAVFTQ